MVNSGKFCVVALAVAIGAAIGTASAAEFVPVVTGLIQPTGVATDANGNLFIADHGAVSGAGAVYESLAPGYGARTLLAPSLAGNPVGIAVDQQGNVFITDAFDDTVKEIPAAGGYTTVTTLAGGFNSVGGIAVDADDNLFVAAPPANMIFELKPSNYANKIALIHILTPEDVALDPQGNLFVAQGRNPGAIIEAFAAIGYQSTTISPALLPQPQGIAVDAQDNVFSTYPNFGTLDEVQAPAFAFPHQIANGFAGPYGVAVDGHGNIFVAENTGQDIVEIPNGNAVPVPALTPGGLALLALVLGGMAWRGLRRGTRLS